MSDVPPVGPVPITVAGGRGIFDLLERSFVRLVHSTACGWSNRYRSLRASALVAPQTTVHASGSSGASTVGAVFLSATTTAATAKLGCGSSMLNGNS